MPSVVFVWKDIGVESEFLKDGGHILIEKGTFVAGNVWKKFGGGDKHLSNSVKVCKNVEIRSVLYRFDSGRENLTGGPDSTPECFFCIEVGELKYCHGVSKLK